jgi:hypothetical protein
MYKLDLRVQFCNTDLFKKSVVNMGIRLYNKVPDHMKDFCCNMHFPQWINLYHTDCMCIVCVYEFNKLFIFIVLLVLM